MIDDYYDEQNYEYFIPNVYTKPKVENLAVKSNYVYE